MNQTKGVSFNNNPATNYMGDNKSQMSIPQMNRQKYNTGGFNRSLGAPTFGGMGQTKGTGDFFNNTMRQEQKEKEIRIKSANTSKYARNHLQLRYNAQNIMTKDPDTFEE